MSPRAVRQPGTEGPAPTGLPGGPHPATDYAALGAQLLRALRGRRSQVALSRRLGFRSNALYAWEAGRRWPTAARFLELARRTGVDPRAAIVRFYGHRPAWMERADPTTAEGVAAFLDDLRGRRSIAELARSAGRTRSALSRWLGARTEPRLPEFLLAVDVASLRLVDFVAELVDPALVPALATRWRMLEAARRVASEAPWSHAVLRALELEAYRALPRHEPSWIARRLGLSPEAEEAGLALLEASGHVRFTGTHWTPTQVMTIDTRRDREAEQALKRWSARSALERMERDGEGLFSHNLFTVSEVDLERLRELQRAFFRQMRAIVAASEPAERVVVANLQLFALDAEAG
jgi:transcriptional regulator with XRE-family HTH domain